MKLSSEQAIEILKSPTNKTLIGAVINQESQLRVFTEELDIDELSKESYWAKFKSIIKTRLRKKTNRVLDFGRYPLPTVDITDSILSDFFKVFDGKNRNFHIDGDRDISTLNRWINETNLENWVENTAREAFKSKPCLFVVIDRDKNGKPYLVLVDSTRLIDARWKDKHTLEYIAFEHSVDGNTRYASVYDDDTYWVFKETDNSGNWVEESSAKNVIGYCPASPFISQPANGKNYFKRRGAFTAALSKLEDWTQFDIYRNFSDHYASFAVTQTPKNKCPHPDCTDGMVTTMEVLDPAHPDVQTPCYNKCPICEDAEGQFVGPGSNIKIKPSADKTIDDGRDIFKFIFPETDKLKYTGEKLDELELEIRHKVVGLNYMASTSDAMNEMQLSGSFASMESVLLRTKKELDTIYVWIVTSVARCYYKDIQIKVDANFGTEFYLVSEDDLQKRYDAAKKSGMPMDELMMIYLQLIETKYKGNPNKVERQKMLIRIDPLPLYDFDEVIKLRENNLIDAKTLSLKANFVNFVARFENENMPITQFGIKLAPEERIKKIIQTLNKYNDELLVEIAKNPVEKVPATK